MLQQPARPSGNVQLPYTTADMAERLAKKKAAKDRQDIIDSLQGGLSYGQGGVDLGSVAKSVGGFLKTAYENMPESIDTPVSSYGTGKSLITEPATLAVRRAVGDITAIPRVGEPSPSYSADKIRQQGVALGLLGAAMDYSQFIPVVVKGAGFASDAINASRIARMNRSPFPKIETPGAFLDVDALQGSRLPARIVDTPATPATRLAEAQTQRGLPPAAQRRIPTSNQLTVEKINVPKGPNTFHDVITIRSFDKTTNKYTGVLTISYDPITKKATVTGMGATNPMVTPQLIAAAATEVRKLVGDVKFPLTPSTDLSASALPFVKRLQAAGLIDPNYQLPDTSLLNDISKDYGPLNFAPAVSDNQIVIDPSSYKSTYNNIFKALAETKRASSPAAPTPEMTAQLQRQAARTELGLNIQDIEFPPAPSPATLAALAADKLEAENYMVKRIKEIDPELAKLPVEQLIENDEAKVFFDQYFKHSKTLDPALEQYEQLHPTAWKEIGTAQEQSGFNAQQMPDQMASLRRYFSHEFPTIQSYLSEIVSNPNLLNLTPKHSQLKSAIQLAGFNETIKDMQTLVSNIDQAFAVVPPTTKPIIAYRGVGLANLYDPYQIAFYRNLKPGQLIYDPALSSTSIDKNLASQWAAANDDAVLIIRVPAGTKTINPISTWQSGISELGTHAHAPGEKEMLLPRNSVFKVIKNDGKFIEVELIPNETNLPATNVRDAGEKLSETMSFTDALSNVSDPYIVQKMIGKQTEKTLRFANVYPEKIDIISRNFVNNKHTSLTRETIDLFDEIDFTLQYVPLGKTANLRLVEDFFPKIKGAVATQDWLELQATSLGADAEASQKVLAEVNKQQQLMKQNPGQNPKPVFITNYGVVIPEPFINIVTQNNPYIGVIAEGQLKYISSADYKEFFKKVVEYKEAHPEIRIANANTLINRLDEVGLLGKNDPDKIKELFEKYIYKIKRVIPANSAI